MSLVSHLEETSAETDVLGLRDEECHIVLHNDDYNMFGYIIDTLMQVCGHTFEQAEQCAIIVHFKGKRDVKTDSCGYLKPLCMALLDARLSAEVEE